MSERDDEAERETTAAKLYAARERTALVQLAMSTLTDRGASSHAHALARKRLTGRDLDDVDISVLSSAECDAYLAITDKLIRHTTGDVDVSAVEVPRPYESTVIACATCKTRRDADYVFVGDLDQDTRESLTQAIAELRTDRGAS